MRMQASFGLLLAACTLARAQAVPDAGWLASDAARSFRERVAELALIYGDSSGIDPRGYKVRARRQGEPVQGCAQVAVTTSLQGVPARDERLRACRQAHAR